MKPTKEKDMKSAYLQETRPIAAIRETYVNKTKGHMIGEDTCNTLWTEDRRKLFKSLKREYGPIVTPMYRDQLQVTGEMAAIQIGYVFRGWDTYQSTGERYQREVWVEFIEQEDDRP